MMRRYFGIFLLLPLFLGCATVNQGGNLEKSEIESLKVKVSRNEGKLSSLEERVAKLEDRVSTNEQNIYDLKKEVEEIKKLVSQITVGAQSPETSREKEVPKVVQMGPKDLYKDAFNAMESGDFEKAKNLFQQIVEQYPDSDLADNALYWIGEIYYSHNDYETAAKYFQDVIDKYPNGNKVPAAMLKLALCYKGMGDIRKAKEILREVINKYPGTPEANIAKVKLMELEK